MSRGKYRFGKRSSDKLATCHPTLVAVAQRALERSPYDFSIIHGYRGEDVQNALFDSGASKKRFPDSMHNHEDDNGKPLSLAIDFAPYINGKIPWNETAIFAVIAGCLFSAASELDVQLRSGLDWDGDGLTSDQTFHDYGHMELIL